MPQTEETNKKLLNTHKGTKKTYSASTNEQKYYQRFNNTKGWRLGATMASLLASILINSPNSHSTENQTNINQLGKPQDAYQHKNQNNFLISEKRPGKNSNTVFVTGLGNSLDEAYKDAANNALIKVMSAFIEADTMIQKNSILKDGIRSQTKSITRNIRSYSQGSISEFDVLDVSSGGAGTIKVHAKVVVNDGKLRAFIRRIAPDIIQLPRGMFAGAAVEIEQEDIRNKIISEKFEALASGKVTSIELGKPILARNFRELYRTYGIWDKAKKDARLRSLYLIPFKIKMNNDYKKNLEYTLNKLSAPHNKDATSEWWWDSSTSGYIGYANPTRDNRALWYFPGLVGRTDTFISPKDKGSNYPYPAIKISLIDTSGKIFLNGRFKRGKKYVNSDRPLHDGLTIFCMNEWAWRSSLSSAESTCGHTHNFSLFRLHRDTNPVFYTELSFYVALNIDLSLLQKIDKVKIEYD